MTLPASLELADTDRYVMDYLGGFSTRCKEES